MLSWTSYVSGAWLNGAQTWDQGRSEYFCKPRSFDSRDIWENGWGLFTCTRGIPRGDPCKKAWSIQCATTRWPWGRVNLASASSALNYPDIFKWNFASRATRKSLHVSLKVFEAARGWILRPRSTGVPRRSHTRCATWLRPFIPTYVVNEQQRKYAKYSEGKISALHYRNC